ncbi:AraC family transcriptional regulator [Cronobacter turicensis]|nr:AraC family transcriptional regulator [Cronobacter turicensis]
MNESLILLTMEGDMEKENLKGEACCLERISLKENSIYFNRMLEDVPANYYHWHQCIEILFVSRGVGIVLVDHRKYTIRPGRLFIFPPGKLHKVFVEQGPRNNYHRTTLHFNALTVIHYLRDFPRQQSVLRQISERSEPARVFDISDIQDYVELLLVRFEKQMTDDFFSVSDNVFLIMQLLSLLPQAETESGQKTFSTRLIRWIDEHYHESCSLEDIAAVAGCSLGHTCRRFNDETGGTLQEYLTMRRLRQACELLIHTQLSVREIAGKVGYLGYAWFITSFRKHIGKSPLQYRKAYRQ